MSTKGLSASFGFSSRNLDQANSYFIKNATSEKSFPQDHIAYLIRNMDSKGLDNFEDTNAPIHRKSALSGNFFRNR